MFFHYLFVLLSLCAKASNPVHLSMGKPLWVSHTCVHVPVYLEAKEGCRIYDPSVKGIIPTRINARGHNVVDVRIKWFEKKDGGQDSFFKNTASLLLEVDLSGRGDAPLRVNVSGLACSNLFVAIRAQD